MSVFKCKMCGGDLEITQDMTVTECEYCGARQTVPQSADENLRNLFNRANTLRIKSEFDKAERLYEKLIQADSTQSEAYWGLILCKYGIEYVDDPETFKKVPTCHRASYDPIVADDDYKSALAHAQPGQRALYEEQAKEIDRIQKEILALAQKEETYDVFICYKETDANGQRTQDSVIANEIYYQLTREGFKVFYAAITLEGKLGSAYEPIIFAALNSAKVMLAIGTKPEHFGAVWVKNEWSRYLKIVSKDRSKLLIPCYKDMDAYELPEEFAHLQAQDMAKIGFINDLVRGIQKVAAKDEPKAEAVTKETVINAGIPGTASLLKRAFMFLEDGEWTSANEYCEKVLDLDPECAEAYLGKLMAELQSKTRKQLQQCTEPFDKRNNYQKAIRFGDEALKNELTGYIDYINTRNENARLEGIYTRAKALMENAATENDYKQAAVLFASIRQYKDADKLFRECCDTAEVVRKDAVLANAKERMRTHVSADYVLALQLLEIIPGWRDADEQTEICQARIQELEAERLEKERMEKERVLRRLQEAAARKKKIKKIVAIVTPIVCVLVAFVIVLVTVIIPNGKYNDAIALLEAGKYREAFAILRELDGYKDSKGVIKEYLAPLFHRNSISAGDGHTVGLRTDGTVVAVGWNDYGQCDVSGWTDIVAISAGHNHTVGLRTDGTVVAVGKNDYGQCDVSDWTDIVAISAGVFHTVGLRADGTVVAIGWHNDDRCDMSGWTDIVAISAGDGHTVGLRSDGTVVAVGWNYHGQCDVSGWTGIVAITAGYKHTVGLRSDGTVVAVGWNDYGQCDVSGWTDIVAISAGDYHTVGLRSDGTVVAVGKNYAVSGRTDIVAIAAGGYYTVGVRADGSVVAVGANGYGQCDVSDWEGIYLPE